MIKKELVLVDSEPENQKEAVDTLVNLASYLQLLSDKQEYLDAVEAREKEFSTAVGFGVAIPHGMSDAVSEAFIGFMKPRRTILWGSEKKEVNLLFLIGVPASKKNVLHLKFISQISKNLMREEFRNQLLNCKTSEEAYTYLDKINQDIERECTCL